MPKFSLTGHCPREALAFAGAAERAGRFILAARCGFATGCGLSVAAWRVLRIVAQPNADLSVAKLARRLRVARQSAHKATRELRRQGFVNIVPAVANRRSLRIILTPQGAELLGTLESAMRLLLLEVTNDLSPQALEAATSLLDGMAKRLRTSRPLLTKQMT
jgi:DNA-binding MarR family transcriptional regulator